MSKVRRLSKPACRAIQSAPVTPPAGPLISRLTGTVSAPAGEVRPPSERKMCRLTSPDIVPSSRLRLRTYRETIGRT